jgi:hypothetical protein
MQTPNNETTTNTGTPELVPYMNTLTSCVNKVVKDGYTDSFKIENKKLFSAAKENSYEPDQVKIVNFYRFEGQSDPGDNAIMYVIETTDGSKGTLIDAYGAYADAGVNKFMDAVEEINKKTNKGETTSMQ